eukprot:TRINITY_DN1094_c0_g1_i1.p1 TRINITY_DN1094_c0_g1~~TRINITY_DN1094_c0_g1_i1.p1  ORF type:complete len:617 (+),score=118.92 TRINITY_DN1094_c0_g1_i1:54-1904(+)
MCIRDRYMGSLNSSIDGFEHQIVEETFAKIGLVHGKDYYWECLTWDDMFNMTLHDVNTFAVGAINMQADTIDLGYVFSQPTVPDGLSILFKPSHSEWFFTVQLRTPLFIVLCISLVILGVVMWITSVPRYPLKFYIYHYISALFLNPEMHNRSIISKVIGIIILALCLICLAFYSSGTTVSLRDQINFQGIYTPDDLKGKEIYSFPGYDRYTDKLQAKLIPVDWSITTEEIANMFENSTNVTFFGIDAAVAAYLDMTLCNVFMPLTKVVRYDFGLMFNENIDREFLLRVNTGLRAVLEERSIEDRIAAYIHKSDTAGCAKKSNSFGGDEIKFVHVWGMFLVMGCFICLGFLTYFIEEFIARLKYRYLDLFHFSGLRQEADAKLQKSVAGLAQLYLNVSIKSMATCNILIYQRFKTALKKLLSTLPAEVVQRLEVKRKRIVESQNKKILNVISAFKENHQKKQKIKEMVRKVFKKNKSESKPIDYSFLDQTSMLDSGTKVALTREELLNTARSRAFISKGKHSGNKNGCISKRKETRMQNNVVVELPTIKADKENSVQRLFRRRKTLTMSRTSFNFINARVEENQQVIQDISELSPLKLASMSKDTGEKKTVISIHQ